MPTHTLTSSEYHSQQMTTPSKTAHRVDLERPPKVPRKNLLLEELENHTPPKEQEVVHKTPEIFSKGNPKRVKVVDPPCPYRINLSNRFDLLEEEFKTFEEPTQYRVKRKHSRRFG